jgi:hypothetical protein
VRFCYNVAYNSIDWPGLGARFKSRFNNKIEAKTWKLFSIMKKGSSFNYSLTPLNPFFVNPFIILHTRYEEKKTDINIWTGVYIVSKFLQRPSGALEVTEIPTETRSK